MTYISRSASGKIDRVLTSGKSILLLGPRQTGKTTLLNQLEPHLFLTFIDPRVRLRYERNPGLLIDEVEALPKPKNKKVPLIIIDEVQKVPAIMDSAQYLIDNKVAQFILTGSSARKLKRGQDINLLPGRVIQCYLDALTWPEIPAPTPKIESLLIDGSLPEIITTKNKKAKHELLDSYILTYLEEEVRAEALVRDLGHFSHFLELAAAESGYPVNMSKLSQQIGIAASTVEAYYQILEDCLITAVIEPITESKTRHRLSKAKKYLFFDLGVRRMAAREGEKPPLKYWGHLFEQYVGIELVRLSHLSDQRFRIRYWSDPSGAEADWVIDKTDEWIPIEVKWTDAPSKHDARHLLTFLSEYKKAKTAYIVCQTPRRMKIANNVFAIPWQELDQII